ncbi:hypothetical protein DFH06DRAFT_1133643 [Mycena polygramma]|nr:hypothetical protein DFH06DRAFT_1133643 [Mycena polygramma]
MPGGAELHEPNFSFTFVLQLPVFPTTKEVERKRISHCPRLCIGSCARERDPDDLTGCRSHDEYKNLEWRVAEGNVRLVPTVIVLELALCTNTPLRRPIGPDFGSLTSYDLAALESTSSGGSEGVLHSTQTIRHIVNSSPEVSRLNLPNPDARINSGISFRNSTATFPHTIMPNGSAFSQWGSQKGVDRDVVAGPSVLMDFDTIPIFPVRNVTSDPLSLNLAAPAPRQENRKRQKLLNSVDYASQIFSNFCWTASYGNMGVVPKSIKIDGPGTASQSTALSDPLEILDLESLPVH